ncbi:hypothetical protein HT136_00770 [Novosphingobium profundi]|uniref:hypothetical protein n=1 Tax=Novosphingobium profundi TaxID=1774954 RepID=UPI001BDA83D6|nr:hypothetical protein [Novosphingobium profundi]MBT0666901.1 hypothetical protein [Novosphingobium profundi]
MSLLLLAAAASAAAAAPVHTVAFEQNGRTYSVDYVAHLETTARPAHANAAGRHAVQRCLTQANVTIERRITDPASGQSMSAMLPGMATLSQARAGRCTAESFRATDLASAHAEVIEARLAAAAQADKPALAATLSAARSLAAR